MDSCRIDVGAEQTGFGEEHVEKTRNVRNTRMKRRLEECRLVLEPLSELDESKGDIRD